MAKGRGDQVVYDESGTLTSNAFYEVRGFDDRIECYAGQDSTWRVIAPHPSSGQLSIRNEFYAYGEVVAHSGEDRVERRCTADPMHVTNHWQGGYEVDLFGGPRVAGFMLGLDGPFAFPSIIDRLQRSGLRGFEVRPVKLQDEADIPGLPPLQEIVFLGRNCLRPMKVVGVPNACPHCGRTPLVCPACGNAEWKCAQCGNGTMIGRPGHQGLNDHRLIVNPFPKDGKILDGKRWDGNDFIQAPGAMLGLVMTKRSLDFFASIRAAPLIASPMRVCVDGMSEEQRRQLAEAVQPIKGP